ncbi:Arginine--tRNA ligase [Colletotrichum trifolii]|uniref:arginine--tRNA ligase n=1 Tax=Colletotrichum trifolii TaxID=5466 RepID=A0A4R8RHW4_COLTR|nr:Arginine--tRNA ligase [Colletotrichum trifolii]
MSHNHGGGGGGMGGMTMGTALFQETNIHLAQSFWYIIAGVVGFLAIVRGVNHLEGMRRLKRRRTDSVSFPTRPSNRITQIWATATAIVREMGHPQLYIPVKGLQWATPPPLGRVLVLLMYWAVIIYMMVNDAVIKDAYFWERIGFRNAWVTIMQMPLLYLLAMKVNVLGYITGTSHERLNWLHRWVARTMFVTATVHGFHFWTEWARADFIETQLRIMPFIKHGLGAWGILVWSFVSGMKPFRGMAYEIFVVQHLVSAVVFIWLVYVHIPTYARHYLWFTVALICFDRLARWALLAWQNTRVGMSRSGGKGVKRLGHEVQVRAVSSSTTVVTIKHVHFSWTAGQYLYLWLPRVGPFEAHPYTIASAHQLPETSVSNSVQLVIRSHGGFSRRLHKFAEQRQASGKQDTLTGFVLGPFGAPPRWDIYETMVLISASTGASFTLPILESIVQCRRSICTTRVDFVLLACQGEEIEFYTERLRELMERAQQAGIELVVHIAITRSGKAREGEVIMALSSDRETGSGSWSQHRRGVSDASAGGDYLEMRVLDVEKADEVPLTRAPRSGSTAGAVREYYSRPDIAALIREPVETSTASLRFQSTLRSPIASPSQKPSFLRRPEVTFVRRPLAHSSRCPIIACFATMATDNAAGQLTAQLEKLSISKLESFPGCYPDVNPVDIYRSHITSLLHHVTGVEKTIIYNALAWTQSLDKGDLVLAVPALRIKGKKPAELTAEWLEKFPESPLIEKPVAFQNGSFLQFWFKPGPLAQVLLPQIAKRGKDFGKNPNNGLRNPQDPSQGSKRIIVEFSSPNIAKPFHAGHLRSTIIGGFLANLYDGAGWHVTRINYLGDWGKQYGLLALGFDRFGNEDALKADPINHLYEVYVKINKEMSEEKEQITAKEQAGEDVTALKDNSLDEQARKYFKAMVAGDEAAVAQWRRFRDLSIVRYKETYARLNIHFDEYSGESQVAESDMEAAANKLQEMNISEESEGAVIIDFTKHVPGKAGKSLERPIIRKKDGTALYLTRDISELLHREKKYGFDHMIYVIASQQDLHLKQLFKIVELMGYPEVTKKCQHINFGMVLGMSTRRGNVKFLDDILRDVGDKMHEVMRKNEVKYSQVENPEATADILGISSVMVQDMSGKRINNYHFDMEAMTSFEGDTGPYLQYAHARLCSIFRKAALTEEELASADLSLLTEKHAIELIRILSQYPDVVQNTLKTLEPTTVLTYLFRMTHVISSSYDHLRIVGSEKELQKARLALYTAARTVLYNGMRLLGLSPVERM